VVAVGRGHFENGTLVPPEVKVGNYVVFRKYSNSLVKLGDVEVYQVSASDITFALGR
jgi:co-chaperonin GroES (HSP10)